MQNADPNLDSIPMLSGSSMKLLRFWETVMKIHIIFNNLFFPIFIIAFILNLRAQEQPVEQALQKQQGHVTYSVSEIPQKLQEASSYLSRFSENLSRIKELGKSNTELAEIANAFSRLKRQTKALNLETESTAILNANQQKWISLKKKIDEWTELVAKRTKELEKQKKNIIDKKDIWLRTDTLARKEKTPGDIPNKINNVIKEYSNAENLTIAEINNSLDLQTKLSEQSVDITFTLEKIERLLLAQKREIFIRNEPPIWKSLSSKPDTTNISRQIGKIEGSFINSTKEFYYENQESLLISLIYFLILLSIIFALKYYSKTIKSDDPKINRTLEILHTPVSSSILIFILVFVFVYRAAPPIFIEVLGILVIFPLVRVLNRIVLPSLKRPLYFLAILLILQQLRLTAASNKEIERIFLILINLFAVGGLVWMLHERRYDKALKTQSQKNKAVVLLKIIIIILSAALISNILGYIRLSLVLINGTINSAYSVLVLLIAMMALEGIIIILLQTKRAQLINVVKNYPEKIEATISKIIKLTIIIWSVIIILDRFGIREDVYNWISGILNNKWEIGKFSISLGNIILFFITIWLSVIIARFFRFILNGDILPRLNLARGVPGAISLITTYLVVGFGIIVAIVGAGVDFNSFALLTGALGVGIGFGLQDIVNNFISGLILIFERPIQVGDAVQVEELSGRVKHIGIRSSIIKTWEGAEVIVPNGNLISNKIINWTFSDQIRRIDIVVGVAYGTDVKLVMETLLNCAKQNDKILKNPLPSVLFNDFGESCLEFELRCWTSDYSIWMDIRSNIRVAIDKSFNERGIEIPFPQRDLHLKTGFNFPGTTSDKK